MIIGVVVANYQQWTSRLTRLCTVCQWGDGCRIGRPFESVDSAGTEDDIGLEYTRSADQNVREFWFKEEVAYRVRFEGRKEPCCETRYDARAS
jgi:hypothetical protein